MKCFNGKAIIFDMDGVLIDSMVYHCKAWQDTGKRFGIDISAEDIYLHEGEKGAFSARFFIHKNGRESNDELVQAMLDAKEKIFQEIADFHLYPYVRDVLDYLKACGNSLALVTGTSMHELQKSLPDDISAYFPVKVTGDQVTKGKPYPEPYLKALERLGITADDAIVVENAPYGIKSAKAAGIYCVALTTSLPAHHLSEADAVFSSMQELYSRITDGSACADSCAC
ncbi:MAG: HAD family phosphatase [Candidatus Auribacterota bacterium]